MHWFVLYTKSRNEKIVADRLNAMGIEVYCPLVKIKRQWSDRMKTVEVPLFRSYCFVHLEEKDRQRALSVEGVVRYLYWLKKPAVVRDAEIEAIRMMLDEVDYNVIEVATFAAGERVKIKSGSFTEQFGEVVQQQGKRVVLRLDSLQMTVNVNLSATIRSR